MVWVWPLHQELRSRHFVSAPLPAIMISGEIFIPCFAGSIPIDLLAGIFGGLYGQAPDDPGRGRTPDREPQAAARNRTQGRCPQSRHRPSGKGSRASRADSAPEARGRPCGPHEPGSERRISSTLQGEEDRPWFPAASISMSSIRDLGSGPSPDSRVPAWPFSPRNSPRQDWKEP